MPPRARIQQEVSDISSVSQLLCYATAGQLEPLLKDFPQGKIAVGAGFGTTTRNAGPTLARGLRHGLSASQLQGLDRIIGALAPNLDATGGLSSLALRLDAQHHDPAKGKRGRGREISVEAHVPPGWTRKILTDPPGGEIGVLMQASALVSEFAVAGKMETPGPIAAISNLYSQEMDQLVRRLILISVGPPTSRNYDAQTLLGMLAVHAFDSVKDCLQDKLLYSPMGFRVWRAVTKLVKLSEDEENNQALRNWVRKLIRAAEELRENSLNPGSSYDLELALAVPDEWSPPGDDWVGEALRTRAQNDRATIRERGTAAMGLWQRAFGGRRENLEKTRDDLLKLAAEFREHDARPDAAAGLRWIAETLEYAIENEVAVCNGWPDIGDPWFAHVKAAADQLDGAGVPDHLLTGTRNLFQHMILQNAGMYRRQAIETVVTGGMNRPVAQALEFLLEAEENESWLRIRVQSALGFMQRYDASTETVLTRACQRAYENLRQIPPENDLPARSQITEMHASLFAVGDCFGAAGAEERAKNARDSLRRILTGIAR